MMGESGIQERKPRGVLRSLYPGEEKTPVLDPAVPDRIPCSYLGLGSGLLSLCYYGNNRAFRVPPGSLYQRLPQGLWGDGQVAHPDAGSLLAACSHSATGRQGWH